MSEQRAFFSIALRVAERLRGDYDILRVIMCVMFSRGVYGLAFISIH